MAAAGIGSMMADLFSGYAVYAPATFVIKALMALAAYLLYRHIHGRKGQYLGAFAAALILLISGGNSSQSDSGLHRLYIRCSAFTCNGKECIFAEDAEGE